MIPNISDAEDSFLYGRSEFNKWADQFMAAWFMPEVALYMAAAVAMAGMKGILTNPQATIKTDALAKKLMGKEY